MTDDDRLKLLHGPYAPPACTRGDVLTCELRGRDVRVGGMSSGRIQWPTALKTGRPSLILCGDLARAVRLESEIAVAHWWGVGLVTVWAWRKALGVGRTTEGTSRLHRDYKPAKLPDDVVESGRQRAREPDAIERMRQAKIGKPAHPATAKALREVASRSWSEDRKRRRAEAVRKLIEGD